MADIFSKTKRSEVMAAIRSRRNRSTELVLASALRKAGIKGWRRHLPIPGTPDFAFPKLKLAVFVDGCFWHGCPEHGNQPKTNQHFWANKLKRNFQRDQRVRRQLKTVGWNVIRLWEHDLNDTDRCVAKIVKLLRIGRSAHS
jgi:DNA mismatch endonuclease (patch repair protein)